ncbi:hypothetical protein AA23498_2850 [Acetobacter nitrogenifigens DSM 23921 = NBRC 105050]|nr:hypothetical protein AA23498_2850 [Acetobacter nitrogenifigens DSM 23921 = NBRC 105050]
MDSGRLSPIGFRFSKTLYHTQPWRAVPSVALLFLFSLSVIDNDVTSTRPLPEDEACGDGKKQPSGYATVEVNDSP